MLKSFSDAACEQWRAEVRTWLASVVPSNWDKAAERRGDPAVSELRRQWDKTLFDAGYAGLSWPKEYGGRGLGPIEEAIFAEECARAHAPQGLAQIGRSLVGPTLIQRGTPDQIRRFLPGILSGTEIWCQGYSEPNAGSDLAALVTSAERDGDVYRINGRKIWTSFAHYADWCLMLARSSREAPRHRNISMLMVNMHQPGLSFVPIRQITGESEFNETIWTGALARVEDRVGEENDGWNVAMSSLTVERGPESMLRRYVDMLAGIDLLSTCCGRPGQRETIHHLDRDASVLRWHIFRAIETRLARENWLPTMAICKVVTTELEQELAGVGVSSRCAEHEEYWRHEYLYSFAGTIAGGSNEIQRNIIAERVLHLPRS
jgi:alkylation response protein AidB-like acyl-CoA dehydrogenase